MNNLAFFHVSVENMKVDICLSTEIHFPVDWQ